MFAESSSASAPGISNSCRAQPPGRRYLRVTKHGNPNRTKIPPRNADSGNLPGDTLAATRRKGKRIPVPGKVLLEWLDASAHMLNQPGAHARERQESDAKRFEQPMEDWLLALIDRYLLPDD